MLSAQVVWMRALELLKEQMTPISYETWITGIQPISVEGNSLVLMVSDELYLNTLRNFYTQTITSCVNAANKTNMTISFMLPEEGGTRSKPKAEVTGPMGECRNLLDRYTFDTFVTGESNRFAHAAALAVAENPSEAYNPLFIYGGVGLGKTHLLHAIGNYVRERHPEYNILFITSEDFTNDVITAIQTNTRQQLRDKYRKLDLLLVDDIQFIGGKDSTELEFFHTFNALRDSNKQIVITSDRQPKDIPVLEERLRARFLWGLITDIQPPDIETRIAILRRKAVRENVDVGDDVLQFIAERVSSNIRELEGSFNRIVAYAGFSKQSITLSFAESVLRDFVAGNSRRVISLDLIVQVVADYYSVTVDEIMSGRRERKIAFPRQVAMYLCRTLTDSSYPAIGDHFGGKHYTTVMYACDQIIKDIETKPEIATAIDDITSRITEE